MPRRARVRRHQPPIPSCLNPVPAGQSGPNRGNRHQSGNLRSFRPIRQRSLTSAATYRCASALNAFIALPLSPRESGDKSPRSKSRRPHGRWIRWADSYAEPSENRVFSRLQHPCRRPRVPRPGQTRHFGYITKKTPFRAPREVDNPPYDNRMWPNPPPKSVFCQSQPSPSQGWHILRR